VGGGPVDTLQQTIDCVSFILLDSTYLLIPAQDGCDSLYIHYTTDLSACVSCGNQCIYITGTTSITGGDTEGAEVFVTYVWNGDTLTTGRRDWTGEVDQLDCFPATDSLRILNVEARVPAGASGSATASAWIVSNPARVQDTTYVSNFSCLAEEVGIRIDTLRNSNGCDSVVVRETRPYPVAQLFVFDEAACNGDTVLLVADATLPGTYTWNTGESGAVLAATTAGRYTVTLTDENGCQTSASAEVRLSDIEIALAPSIAGPLWLSDDPLEVWQGAAVELRATVSGTSLDYDILWNGGPQIGDTVFNFVAEQSDTITVGVIDEYGCFAQAFLPIAVRPAKVFVPTAFSPNGDELNEEFGVYTSPNVEEVRVQIFQRSGGMLLDIIPQAVPDGESALYWPVWNGLFSGQTLNPQPLTWQIRYRLYRGEWRTRAGELILVR